MNLVMTGAGRYVEVRGRLKKRRSTKKRYGRTSTLGGERFVSWWTCEVVDRCTSMHIAEQRQINTEAELIALLRGLDNAIRTLDDFPGPGSGRQCYLRNNA
ncbi:MAG: hypothetical protein MRJ92_04665 [Nitrospira sp.]|nr:hypothetical protein [Nitrospira sp.]